MKKRPNSYGKADKRRHIRRDIGMRGTIILGDGKRMRCTVNDISETGAMLVLTSAEVLPNNFTLEIGSGAVSRRCYKMRQNGKSAGVRFPERGMTGG